MARLWIQQRDLTFCVGIPGRDPEFPAIWIKLNGMYMAHLSTREAEEAAAFSSGEIDAVDINVVAFGVGPIFANEESFVYKRKTAPQRTPPAGNIPKERGASFFLSDMVKAMRNNRNPLPIRVV